MAEKFRFLKQKFELRRQLGEVWPNSFIPQIMQAGHEDTRLGPVDGRRPCEERHLRCPSQHALCLGGNVVPARSRGRFIIDNSCLKMKSLSIKHPEMEKLPRKDHIQP